MVARSHVPDASDIVWLEFDPQVRHARKKGAVSADVMAHVRAKIKALLLIP